MRDEATSLEAPTLRPATATATSGPGRLDEVSPLAAVALRHPRDAFADRVRLASEWRALGWHAEPDFDAAVAEFDTLVRVLEDAGAEVLWLPGDPGLTADALYVRDAALQAPAGMLLAAMGKPARAAEPERAGAAFAAAGIPVAGAIAGDGRLEGGDLIWLDPKTIFVGRTYRTNDAGIAQLARLVGPEVSVHAFDMPHFRGAGDVFHLMSVWSPLGPDLSLLYSPLVPVRLRELLLARGHSLVEVPDAEFPTMACNVLATAPRQAVMIDGNPETRRRLEAAGVAVTTIKAEEICRKGEGGPTCLTRPLRRH